MVDTKLLDLRKCKRAIIPDGIEKVGNRLFWRSEIESVEIPPSMKIIGFDTFFKCKNLKRVVFAVGGRLEKIGPRSFYGTGIEKITVPKNVTEIDDYAFYDCENLK